MIRNVNLKMLGLIVTKQNKKKVTKSKLKILNSILKHTRIHSSMTTIVNKKEKQNKTLQVFMNTIVYIRKSLKLNYNGHTCLVSSRKRQPNT
jgi:hypothetical protein